MQTPPLYMTDTRKRQALSFTYQLHVRSVDSHITSLSTTFPWCLLQLRLRGGANIIFVKWKPNIVIALLKIFNVLYPKIKSKYLTLKNKIQMQGSYLLARFHATSSLNLYAPATRPSEFLPWTNLLLILGIETGGSLLPESYLLGQFLHILQEWAE